MRYLRVKCIEKYQPQSSKRLPWIKLMTELLEPTRQPWTTDLPDAVKTLLYHIWLMASVHGGRIPEDWLTRERLNLKSRPNLELILELGLVWFENEDGTVSEHSHARLARSGYLSSGSLASSDEELGFSQETAFASLWADYPRRIGRKDAFKHFKATVKTAEDCIRVRAALARYRADVAGRDMQYIQHGSTWFNNWQDWEHYVPPPRARERNSDGFSQPGESMIYEVMSFEREHGERPDDAALRASWDAMFTGEFHFTPDEWDAADYAGRDRLAALKRGAA